MVAGQRVLVLVADASTSYRASYDLALKLDAHAFHTDPTWNAKGFVVSEDTVLADWVDLPITMELPTELSALLHVGLKKCKGSQTSAVVGAHLPIQLVQVRLPALRTTGLRAAATRLTLLEAGARLPTRRRPISINAGAPPASTEDPALSTSLALSKQLGRDAGTIAPPPGLPRPPRPVAASNGVCLGESRVKRALRLRRPDHRCAVSSLRAPILTPMKRLSGSFFLKWARSWSLPCSECRTIAREEWVWWCTRGRRKHSVPSLTYQMVDRFPLIVQVDKYTLQIIVARLPRGLLVADNQGETMPLLRLFRIWTN